MNNFKQVIVLTNEEKITSELLDRYKDSIIYLKTNIQYNWDAEKYFEYLKPKYTVKGEKYDRYEPTERKYTVTFQRESLIDVVVRDLDTRDFPTRKEVEEWRIYFSEKFPSIAKKYNWTETVNTPKIREYKFFWENNKIIKVVMAENENNIFTLPFDIVDKFEKIIVENSLEKDHYKNYFASIDLIIKGAYEILDRPRSIYAFVNKLKTFREKYKNHIDIQVVLNCKDPITNTPFSLVKRNNQIKGSFISRRRCSIIINYMDKYLDHSDERKIIGNPTRLICYLANNTSYVCNSKGELKF